TGLAAMAGSPESGYNVRAVLDALQGSGRITVPGEGSWPAPDGIAELVLATQPTGTATRAGSGAPTEAYTSGGPTGGHQYGCATNAAMYALMSGASNDSPHGHADVGNVVVRHGEQSVLADLGQRDYGFRGRPVWRAATKAHTTVGIARPGGAVEQRAGGSGTVAVDGADLVMTGDAALNGVTAWERRVSLTDASVRIADRLSSSAAVPLSVSYLVGAPRSAVTDAGDGTLHVRLADGSTWQLVPPAGLPATVTDAAPSPPYVDAPSIEPLAQSRTLVTVTATVHGTLDLVAEVRKVG
ncbi:MAG: heparinase II/III domain-containing protein, partial [Actinomycetes bacterium]